MDFVVCIEVVFDEVIVVFMVKAVLVLKVISVLTIFDFERNELKKKLVLLKMNQLPEWRTKLVSISGILCLQMQKKKKPAQI